MLRRRIVLSFDLNLNPFYSVTGNLLDFNDTNDSIIFSIDGVLSRCTCIKRNDSSLSSVMVDLIADNVLFNLENNLSGSAVITGNVVRIFSNIWIFGKIFCQPRPLERILPTTPFGAKMALPNTPRWIRHCFRTGCKWHTHAMLLCQ